MKKRFFAALAAMVLTMAAFAVDFPAYLDMYGNAIMSYDKGKLPDNLVIPEGVTGIGRYAFKNCESLVNITIPGSVKFIGDSAFDGCTSLKSVTIAGGVEQIGRGAFSRCENLKEVNFTGTKAEWKAIKGSSEVESPCIQCSDGYIGIKDVPAYLKMKGMKITGSDKNLPNNILIPDGVTEIGSSAFKGCTSLASVDISDSVKIIGGEAFTSCISLASVTIPSSVTSIEEKAFNNCTSLKEIQFGGTMAQWKAIKGNVKVNVPCIQCSDGYIGVKNVPDYLKMNGTRVTGYNKGLPTTLVIPDGVTVISSSAFKGCSKIDSVTIPTTVTEIGGNAFDGCTYLEHLTIPISVTKIGWGAFSGCSSLASVTIEDGLTEISEYAFNDCVSLVSVSISGNVKKIGDYAFNGCSSLESVTIPDGVTEIGELAFYNCTSLAEVRISTTVTTIGRNAFLEYAKLKEIQFAGTKAQWKAIKGSSGVKIPGIQCSDGYIGVKDVPDYLKINSTRVTGHNKGLPTALVIPDGVTAIGDMAFNDCTGLTSVKIPTGVTSIGRYAFIRCTSLESITIPDDVTSIGEGAFEGCTSLASVTIPGSVAEISEKAFNGCKNLKSVTISRGVMNLGNGAFGGCMSLASVVIPRSVTSINSAFSGCTSLKELQFDGSLTQWKAVKGNDKVNYIPCIQCSDGYIGIKNVPEYLMVNREGDSIAVTGFTGTVPANVIIPEGVTSIGGEAFTRCTNLVSVTIPGSVTSIQAGYILSGAFTECTNLVTVTIADGVMSIDHAAFYGCTNLASVKLPVSVTSIGSYAFEGIKNLKIQYDGTKAQWDKIKKGSDGLRGGPYEEEIGSFVVQCSDGDVFVQ